MEQLLDRIIDGMDFETFIRAKSEEDAKSVMLQLLKNMGFKDVDLVFVEYQGSGARIRARAYIHRSGDKYGWLSLEEKEEN